MDFFERSVVVLCGGVLLPAPGHCHQSVGSASGDGLELHHRRGQTSEDGCAGSASSGAGAAHGAGGAVSVAGGGHQSDSQLGTQVDLSGLVGD